LPITLAEVDDNLQGSDLDSAYGRQVWQGAYVLKVNENEVSVRGRISHNDVIDIERYGPAYDEGVGATREDRNGNIWTKQDNGMWKIVDNVPEGYEGLEWGDYLIDSQPGGINYYNNLPYQNNVQRSLFMDDVLYTISLSKVKANSLGDLDDIREVDLPFEEIRYYDYEVAF